MAAVKRRFFAFDLAFRTVGVLFATGGGVEVVGAEVFEGFLGGEFEVDVVVKALELLAEAILETVRIGFILAGAESSLVHIWALEGFEVLVLLSGLGSFVHLLGTTVVLAGHVVAF